MAVHVFHPLDELEDGGACRSAGDPRAALRYLAKQM
jgi:hypothetical protein